MKGVIVYVQASLQKIFGITLILISFFVIFPLMIYILVEGLPRLNYMAFMITSSRIRALHHLRELLILERESEREKDHLDHNCELICGPERTYGPWLWDKC